MTKKKLLFIINPISGGKSKSKMQDLIRNHLNHDIFDYQIIFTEFAGHAKEIVDKQADGFNVIIAVGGDGTINETAESLTKKNIPLGIIPMGSGNGLARHLGIPLKPINAIQAINHSEIIEIDTAVLNDHFFVSIAGVGFDSLIAAEFEKAKGRGFINYARLSTKEYFAYQEQNYQITLDGKKIERQAALVTFANSSQFGYNTKIAPHANLCDGLLDVCILKKPNLIQMPLLMKQIWSGEADKSFLLEIIQAKHIIIEPNKNTYANVDGESIQVGERVEVLLKPNSLKLFIPKK